MPPKQLQMCWLLQSHSPPFSLLFALRRMTSGNCASVTPCSLPSCWVWPMRGPSRKMEKNGVFIPLFPPHQVVLFIYLSHRPLLLSGTLHTAVLSSLYPPLPSPMLGPGVVEASNFCYPLRAAPFRVSFLSPHLWKESLFHLCPV